MVQGKHSQGQKKCYLDQACVQWDRCRTYRHADQERRHSAANLAWWTFTFVVIIRAFNFL